MRIVDVCLYSGEDIMDLRLEYLAKIMDHFYIFESATAQNGLPKPLYGKALLERFAHLADKITYINVDDTTDFRPMGSELKDFLHNFTPETAKRFRRRALSREFLFRRKMTDYIRDYLPEEDIVYFADCDEIPTKECVEFVRLNHAKLPYPLYILGECFDYNVKSPSAYLQMFWFETFFMPVSQVKNIPTLWDIRFKNHFHNNHNYVDKTDYLLVKKNKTLSIHHNDTIIQRSIMQTENGRDYRPLQFHLRNFQDIAGNYRKILHSSYYPKIGLTVEIFKEFLVADFEFYKNMLFKLLHTYRLRQSVAYKYLYEVMPDMLYNFGVEMFERQNMMPDDKILLENYQALYSPFIEDTRKIMHV